MPAIPGSTRDPITWRLLQHAGTHWPQLSTVQVRCRGSFAYITGVLPGGEQIPLCRLRYGGSAHSFGFAIYSAARGRYDDAVLPTGLHAGTPQEALDTACTVHLAGLGHEPADEPPTNLRGYPLRSRRRAWCRASPRICAIRIRSACERSSNTRSSITLAHWPAADRASASTSARCRSTTLTRAPMMTCFGRRVAKWTSPTRRRRSAEAFGTYQGPHRHISRGRSLLRRRRPGILSRSRRLISPISPGSGHGRSRIGRAEWIRWARTKAIEYGAILGDADAGAAHPGIASGSAPA
jgi:hypothetical protein